MAVSRLSNIHILPSRGVRARALAIALLIIAPLLTGLLALWLGQDANWDLRNYHWYNAYALWNGRYLTDLLPSQTPFFYNPTLDIPFYLLASHVPARVAGYILGAVQGLNFVLLFMLAHLSLKVPNPRHKVLVCAAVAVLGLLGAGGIAQIGTTFYDNVTSLGIFLSALLVVRHFDRLLKDNWQKASLRAALTGLPAGMMMGLKLPCVVFCVGLCGSLLLVAGPWRRRLLISFMFGVGVLFGVAMTLGHWSWFLQNNFGSPLFPYFNDLFHSPLAPLTSARDIQYVPWTLHDRLLFPFLFGQNPRMVGEIPWRDWRIPLLYGLLPLAILVRLFFGRSKIASDQIVEPYAARYLLWMSVIAYFIWMLMFAIYRYAIPLEMLAPLLIVFAVGMLPFRLSTRGMLAALILAVIALTIQPGNWGRVPHWLDHAIEIERPNVPDRADLMILMAGFEPYSHVISEFPPKPVFVRIQSNFVSPGEDKGINQMIRQRVVDHKGPFMMLIPSYQHGLAQAALKAYGLVLLPQSCQTVTDRLYDSKLQLCDVARSTKVKS